GGAGDPRVAGGDGRGGRTAVARRPRARRGVFPGRRGVRELVRELARRRPTPEVMGRASAERHHSMVNEWWGGRAMVTGAIFDVDGTLMDTVPHHVRAWMQAFREF